MIAVGARVTVVRSGSHESYVGRVGRVVEYESAWNHALVQFEANDLCLFSSRCWFSSRDLAEVCVIEQLSDLAELDRVERV